MQIKTITRCHITQTRMVTVKRRNIECWQGRGEDGGPHTLRWEYKMVQLLWKTVWQLFKNLNVQLLHDHRDFIPRYICERS